MRLSDDDISAIIEREIQQSQGYDSDVLSSKRQSALNYYSGIMPAPAEGRSAIVSTDLADAVHSMLAQIQPILKSTLLEFVPNGDEDEQAAQSESDFTRDQMSRSGGWRTIFEACHDALLIGNGWMKISTDDDVRVTEDVYPPDLPDEAIFIISQPTAENQEVKVTSSATKTTAKRTTTTTKLKFESIPPEDMLFSEGRGYESIQDQRFVAQKKLYTCAQLSEMGISDQVISELPDGDAAFWPAVNARQGIYGNDDAQAAQNSERLKIVYCCYIRMSMRDNNSSELRYVWYSGGEILKNEPVSHVPFVTGSSIPMPHRVQGTGLFELLAAIQEGKTHILRNYMDNLDVMNSSRIGAVEGQVNMSDLTSGRINGVVRMRNPNAVVPLPSNDIGPQAIQGLDYLDNVRVQRIGASMDMNEAQAALMSASATAAAGSLGMVEKMGGWFATNLVETMLKPAFMAVHRLLRTEIAGPVMMKQRGRWEQSDAGQWQERDVLEVVMGMTTAEKAQRLQGLSAVIQQQTGLAASGGMGSLVDKGKLYNAMTDYLRAADLGQPEQYFVDPDSEEAMAADQQAAQAQEQQQQQMQQMQQQMVQMQQQFELQKQDNDLKFKYYDANLDAEIEEAKLTASSIIDIKKLDNSVDKSDVKTASQ